MGEHYPKLKSGETVFVKRGKQFLRLSCCDCGLVHDIDVELTRKGYFKVRMWRRNRSTGQLRRHRKIKLTYGETA